MQASEQMFGSKSVFLLGRTKYRRAYYRPTATDAAMEFKPGSPGARSYGSQCECRRPRRSAPGHVHEKSRRSYRGFREPDSVLAAHRLLPIKGNRLCSMLGKWVTQISMQINGDPHRAFARIQKDFSFAAGTVPRLLRPQAGPFAPARSRCVCRSFRQSPC